MIHLRLVDKEIKEEILDLHLNPRRRCVWTRSGFPRCPRHLGNHGLPEVVNWQDLRVGWSSFQAGYASSMMLTGQN